MYLSSVRTRYLTAGEMALNHKAFQSIPKHFIAIRSLNKLGQAARLPPLGLGLMPTSPGRA